MIAKLELYIGTLLVTVAVIAFIIWNVSSPRLLARGMMQFGVAMALVIGAILILLSLGQKIHEGLFDKVTLSLAVAAIVFAVWQFWDARAETVKIEQIVLSVSTRYIAKFPDYFPAITKLISTANKDDRLLIMVDFVGSGHYSAPASYKEYLTEIKYAKDRGVDVEILAYGEGAARDSLQIQFKKEDFLKTPRKDHLSDYLKYYSIQERPSTNEELLNLLVATEDRFCRQLADEEIPVKSVADRQAVFFWMKDGKEMIFAFPNESEKGFAFATKDDHLLSVFHDLFNRKWGQATLTNGHCFPHPKLF